MSTRISEIVHGWLGWCPNGHTVKHGGGGNARKGLAAANPALRQPGPSGSGRSGELWMTKYEHTQRGDTVIGIFLFALALVLVPMFFYGFQLAQVAGIGILLVVLAMFSTLTVSADNEALRIRFGPLGLIRKSWPVSDIAAATPVVTPWYSGFGIRHTPFGPLYTVHGRSAVEVLLLSGKTFRIGTDEPDALATAIERIAATGNGRTGRTG